MPYGGVIRSLSLYRNLTSEDLAAVWDEFSRRVQALADTGLTRDEAILRVAEGDEAIIEGETCRDTALRFGVLPRSATERVPVGRRDLSVLLAAAHALLDAERGAVLDWQLPLPGDFTYQDLQDVARRLGNP
jgi:hypothetical protein